MGAQASCEALGVCRDRQRLQQGIPCIPSQHPEPDISTMRPRQTPATDLSYALTPSTTRTNFPGYSSEKSTRVSTTSGTSRVVPESYSSRHSWGAKDSGVLVPVASIESPFARGSLAEAASSARSQFARAEEALVSNTTTAYADEGRLAPDLQRKNPMDDIGGLCIGASPVANGLCIVEPVPEAVPEVRKASKNAWQEEERKASKEPAGKEEDQYDARREFCKAAFATTTMLLFWAGIVAYVMMGSSSFVAPECPTDDDAVELDPPLMCEPCSGGGLILPLGAEYEQSFGKTIRAVLYFVGLLWTFAGIGVVCDQFMAAIEEVTSKTYSVWRNLKDGGRSKTKIKVWNDTIANLSLMALGSSAPEILLNVVEVMGNDFFAGELGPSTIVGSAAFNLLVIAAVCVSAVPAPAVKFIEQTDVFCVTAFFSVFAYVWMIIVLGVSSPNKIDVWEAVATFAFLPLLLVLAFLADKGYLAPFFKLFSTGIELPGQTTAEERAAELLETQYSKELPKHATELVVTEELKQSARKGPDSSRAALESEIIRSIAGSQQFSLNEINGGDLASGPELTFGFDEPMHYVLECAGSVALKVVASFKGDIAVEMEFSTYGGTAKPDSRFRHKSGTLTFEAGEVEKTIEVEILDNEQWDADEQFVVELSDLRVIGKSHSGANLKPRLGIAQATVVVLNDDMPGTIDFDVREMYVQSGDTVLLGVNRSHGSCGEARVQYCTQADTAVEGTEYTETSGQLLFRQGDTFKAVRLKIAGAQRKFNEDLIFRVRLHSPSPGVGLGSDLERIRMERRLANQAFERSTSETTRSTSKEAPSATCTVFIAANVKPNSLLRQCRAFSKFINVSETCEAWRNQFVSVFYCGGSPEDQAEAAPGDWLMHWTVLPFSILFTIVPPVSTCGGWLTFWVALCMIGGVTAIVGDMAGLLGCVAGIPDDITAITLVALGTSLPDTFASKIAAEQDDTADNCVGNVTGSNSVNVFLGLGLPWMIAAFHWSSAGRNDDWDRHLYKGTSFQDSFAAQYPAGGFIVPAGSLVFSVFVFSGCAAVCLGMLGVRRLKYGGEIGGPQYAQSRDSMILVFLWVVYIVASSLNSIMS